MHSLARQIPNFLSIARITATPLLTWCAIVGAERAFRSWFKRMLSYSACWSVSGPPS